MGDRNNTRQEQSPVKGNCPVEYLDIDRLMGLEPDADRQVLQFINDFVAAHAPDQGHTDYMYNTFSSGYCYHFALMLQQVFRTACGRPDRGEICIMAPYGHICWVDDNHIPYDIGGIYYGEAQYYIPIEYMGAGMLLDFLHVPGMVHDTHEDEIKEMIRQYERAVRYDPERDHAMAHHAKSAYWQAVHRGNSRRPVKNDDGKEQAWETTNSQGRT